MAQLKVASLRWTKLWLLDGVCLAGALVIASQFRGFMSLLLASGLSFIGFFNQFIYLHEASHLSLRGPKSAQKAVGWLAGCLLLIPFPLWFEHHRIHHRNTHVNGDNAFVPLTQADQPSFADELLVLSFRTILIGLSLPITVILCLADHVLVRKTNRTFNPSWKTASYGVLSILFSIALTILIGIRLGTTEWLFVWFLPLLAAHTLFSSITFLHHIHERSPFLERVAEQSHQDQMIRLTNHLVFPKWFHALTHHSHYHLAHHISPSCDWQALRSKTESLLASNSGQIRTLKFSFATVFKHALNHSKQTQLNQEARWFALFEEF